MYRSLIVLCALVFALGSNSNGISHIVLDYIVFEGVITNGSEFDVICVYDSQWSAFNTVSLPIIKERDEGREITPVS